MKFLALSDFSLFLMISKKSENVKFRELHRIDRPSITENVKFREIHDSETQVIFVVPGMYLGQIEGFPLHFGTLAIIWVAPVVFFPRTYSFQTLRSEKDGFTTPEARLRRCSSKTPSDAATVPTVSPPKGGGKGALKGKSKSALLALMAGKGFKGFESKVKGKGKKPPESDSTEEEPPPKKFPMPEQPDDPPKLPKAKVKVNTPKSTRKFKRLRNLKGSKEISVGEEDLDETPKKADVKTKGKGKGKKVPPPDDEAEEEEPDETPKKADVKTKGKGKKVPKSDDKAEEEEPDETGKKADVKTKGKGKKVPKSDDEAEEEEPDETPKKADVKTKGKGKGKKVPKPDDEAEEEEPDETPKKADVKTKGKGKGKNVPKPDDKAEEEEPDETSKKADVKTRGKGKKVPKSDDEAEEEEPDETGKKTDVKTRGKGKGKKVPKPDDKAEEEEPKDTRKKADVKTRGKEKKVKEKKHDSDSGDEAYMYPPCPEERRHLKGASTEAWRGNDGQKTRQLKLEDLRHIVRTPRICFMSRQRESVPKTQQRHIGEWCVKVETQKQKKGKSKGKGDAKAKGKGQVKGKASDGESDGEGKFSCKTPNIAKHLPVKNVVLENHVWKLLCSPPKTLIETSWEKLDCFIVYCNKVFIRLPMNVACRQWRTSWYDTWPTSHCRCAFKKSSFNLNNLFNLNSFPGNAPTLPSPLTRFAS